MKRILYVTYRNFYPVSSGEKITMMQNLKLLSRYYDVDCLIIDEKKNFSESNDLINEYCNEVIQLYYPPKIVKTLRCLLNFFTRKPIQNGYFYSKKAATFIKNNYKKYDLIFCTHMRTGQYVESLKEIKKILVCPDCITLNSKSEASNSKGFRKLIFKIDANNVKRFETKIYRKFDYLYVISQRDREQLIQMDHSISPKTGLLFNYARDLGYSPKIKETSTKQICFLGRLEYGPNATAITHFVNIIMPQLKTKFSDLIFNIYGGGSAKRIKSISKKDDVVIHGFVDDVASEIQKNTFVIAPMISGSGTQNKILECMMLKKLVITTKIGLDGLHNLTGSEIVSADSDDDFVEKCIYYLSDKSKDERDLIGEKARKYVLENYSEIQFEKQLVEPLKGLLDDSRE